MCVCVCEWHISMYVWLCVCVGGGGGRVGGSRGGGCRGGCCLRAGKDRRNESEFQRRKLFSRTFIPYYTCAYV